MNDSLRGLRALVCGSTQGIGRATAELLAEQGAEVTLFARNQPKLAEVLGGLRCEHGQNHDTIAADFTDTEAVRSTVQRQVDPDRPYRILVNNTGGPPGGPIADAEPEAFITAFRAHLINNQTLVQALLPGFRSAGYGRVINIISTSVKAPIPGLGVSNTIRGAVASWAKTLATELGPHGITVNNVLPGFTNTARLNQLFVAKASKMGQAVDEITDTAIASIPAGRLGRPEEIAAAVAFLASPMAGYINGINLPVDGGRLPTL